MFLFVISNYKSLFYNTTHDVFPDVLHNCFVIATKPINRFVHCQLLSIPTGKMSTINFIFLSLNTEILRIGNGHPCSSTVFHHFHKIENFSTWYWLMYATVSNTTTSFASLSTKMKIQWLP
jgi:hypothetical protein